MKFAVICFGLLLVLMLSACSDDEFKASHHDLGHCPEYKEELKCIEHKIFEKRGGIFVRKQEVCLDQMIQRGVPVCGFECYSESEVK